MRTHHPDEALQPTFKRWLTAREIASVALPGAPSCPNAALRFVKSLMREDGSPHLWRMRAGMAPALSGIEVHYSSLPLEAAVTYEARQRTALASAQPHDKRLARLGTGILSTAEGGRMRAFIIQRVLAEPRAPVVALRDRCCERFGNEVVVIAQGVPTLVPMPSFRTFQGFVAALRETGAVDVRH